MSGILKRLSDIFRTRRGQGYLVGKDLDSNSYFELPNINGDPDPRKTRRIVRFKEHKELGEYDQSTLPTQWLMWLRHTRKSAPTIEELLEDRKRIEIVQHNASVLEYQENQRRFLLEEKAQKETLERQKLVEESYNRPSTSNSRATAVPTSSVSDIKADEEARSRVLSERQIDSEHVVQERKVDMDVWEASRKRLEEKDERSDVQKSKSQSIESGRQRARRVMSQSPLSAFDISIVENRQSNQQQPPKQEKSQLNRHFGRSTGSGEDWTPQEWSSRPIKR